MKRRALVYGDGAMADILEITDHIAADSPINADKVLARLEAKIQSLAVMPERGRKVPELQWHGITTIHEVFELPWRILYLIKADSVLVVGVYDGRRLLDDLLIERVLRHQDGGSSSRHP